MKTDIDKNIKKEKNIKMDKNMQAENIHKNVDEITINDFVTKNDKDVLELKKHVLSSGSVVPLLHFRKLNELYDRGLLYSTSWWPQYRNV